MENLMKTMNDDQIKADRNGKAVVYKYLCDTFQNAVTKIFDTDHRNTTARYDLLVQYANGFINLIEVKTRDCNSVKSPFSLNGKQCYATTLIHKEKVDTLNQEAEKCGGAKAILYIYYADKALYVFDCKTIAEQAKVVYSDNHYSKLSSDRMTKSWKYEFPFSLGTFLGFYEVPDLNMEFFDKNVEEYI